MKYFNLTLMLMISFTILGCSSNKALNFSEQSIEGFLEEKIPTGWRASSIYPENFHISIDRGIAHSGFRSASIHSTIAMQDQYVSLSQIIKAEKYAGKRIRFKACVRTREITKHAGLFFRADSKTHRTIAFDNMNDRSITGTRDWRFYKIEIDVPEDAVVLYYGAMMYGQGQTWIDDCSITVISDQIRPARQRQGSTKKYKEIPGTFEGPVNMGFEDVR